MNDKSNMHTPFEQQELLLRERGIMVFDNITRLPVYGEPYVSPHLIICICHQGISRIEYDIQPTLFQTHELCVLYPNHIILAHESTGDYRATLIVITQEFLNNLQHRSSYRYELEYRRRPAFQLTDQQYKTVCNFVRTMQSINQHDIPHRQTLMAELVSVFSLMVDDFRFGDKQELPEWKSGEKLFHRFFDALALHLHESHEIRYYAELLCLSPKYFSMLIKQETGKSAGDWIAQYIVIQAKSLLSNRQDLNIQQISERLGFREQSSFSRYFRTYTGISPSEYRKQ